MLEAGDFDLMKPLFEHCMRLLPIRKLATRKYFGHDGAHFPETHTIWGTYLNYNYGADRNGKGDGVPDNPFVRRYWVNGLELVLLMLDYYDLSDAGDEFLRETLLPFAIEITTFFDQHWPRDIDGRIRFEPAQSLETWHVAANPLPEIVALGHVLPRLLRLTDDPRYTGQWRRTLADLPAVPTESDPETGNTRWIPAETYSVSANLENPELVALFPYRLGILTDAPERQAIAHATWNARRSRDGHGWHQTSIQAAQLGLTDEVRDYVTGNLSHTAPGFRFPAMWGPNFDWMPDQDHGTVLVTALQYMALQYDGENIVLLPAWPRDWNAHFKLHAPRDTTVECRIHRRGDHRTHRRARIPACRHRQPGLRPSPN